MVIAARPQNAQTDSQTAMSSAYMGRGPFRGMAPGGNSWTQQQAAVTNVFNPEIEILRARAKTKEMEKSSKVRARFLASIGTITAKSHICYKGDFQLMDKRSTTPTSAGRTGASAPGSFSTFAGITIDLAQIPQTAFKHYMRAAIDGKFHFTQDNRIHGAFVGLGDQELTIQETRWVINEGLLCAYMNFVLAGSGLNQYEVGSTTQVNSGLTCIQKGKFSLPNTSGENLFVGDVVAIMYPLAEDIMNPATAGAPKPGHESGVSIARGDARARIMRVEWSQDDSCYVASMGGMERVKIRSVDYLDDALSYDEIQKADPRRWIVPWATVEKEASDNGLVDVATI